MDPFLMKMYILLGGGFKHFFIFTLIPGEDFQFDLRIFFRWVGSTTNQFYKLVTDDITPISGVISPLLITGPWVQPCSGVTN